MDLEIWVRNKDSNMRYEVDSVADLFTSIIITENYYSANTFELVVPLTPENVIRYIPDTLVRADGVFYFVDDVSVANEESGILSVSGKSLSGKYEDRIIDPPINLNDTPQKIVQALFTNYMIRPSDNKRKYEYLSIESVDVGDFPDAKITYQSSYATIKDAVETICKTYDFGFKETAKVLENGIMFDPMNVITLYRGEDKASWVEISKHFETLLNESYKNSIADYKTTARVFGEGEGSSRTNITIGNDFSGVDRKELYVDARDLQKAGENGAPGMSDEAYRALLTNRGNEKLGDQQRILSINGGINIRSTLYEIGKDYGLGDTVTLTSPLYALEGQFPIVSLKKTWDTTGEYIDTSFGIEANTIFQILNRK